MEIMKTVNKVILSIISIVGMITVFYGIAIPFLPTTLGPLDRLIVAVTLCAIGGMLWILSVSLLKEIK